MEYTIETKRSSVVQSPTLAYCLAERLNSRKFLEDSKERVNTVVLTVSTERFCLLFYNHGIVCFAQWESSSSSSISSP